MIDIHILLAPVIAMAITAALGPIIIPILHRIKAGQSIREEGPKSHMVKAGTPTMGGFMIIISVLITCIALGGLNRDMVMLLVTLLAFSAIGFVDDFVKVCKHRNLGLTAKQKLALQILIAVVLSIYQMKTSELGTSIYVPFIKDYVNIGILYVPFVAFVVVAMTNAVNLTDGLDGLAAGVTALVAFTLAVFAIQFGHMVPSVYTMAIGGACIGFLIYNHHPAKVFMGDTGSLGLGGALSAAAILMHTELILPVAGGIFVAEALSVIIQVTHFKRTGKRVFRMAPLHHHFELGGWKETKVVIVFWLVTLLLCVISLLIF